MSKKNKYSKAARRKGFLNGLTAKMPTAGNAKNSGIELLKDLGMGVVGAGVGVAMGKPSLLIGIGVTFLGHYTGSSLVSSAGIGMIASGGTKVVSDAVSGVEGMDGMEQVKTRLKAFGNNLKERLYLDKIIKAKPKEEGTSGLGRVRYFKYPQAEVKELDMSGLDSIERDLEASAASYQRQMSGTNGIEGYDEVSGLGNDPIY